MKNKLKKIVNLHRYVGLGICIFVVHLAITGIFLNHSIGLRLDRTFVAWPWLLSQYNLIVPEPENIFTIGKNNFSRFSDEVFFNDNSIFSIENDLVGVIENKNNFILASNSVLNVVSNEGFLLTREDILPFTIKKIAESVVDFYNSKSKVLPVNREKYFPNRGALNITKLKSIGYSSKFDLKEALEDINYDTIL